MSNYESLSMDLSEIHWKNRTHRGETVIFKFIICNDEFVFEKREYGKGEKRSVFPINIEEKINS